MRNLVNFHTATQKSKSFTPMGYFCPKYMRFDLYIRKRGVISHDTEKWCNIWEILTLWFKKWHEELGELSSLEHPKFWKLYIDGLFLSKANIVLVRNFQRDLCVITLKGVAKFKWKLTCGLKSHLRNLLNFYESSWKSKNWRFDWIRLSKVYKYLDEKVEKSYVSWNWRVMWEILWNLMWAVASLEIWTLMCYFCQ